MSVRIYQLSKEVGMTNKEVITLLQERGLNVESASNTIPNIYAESFIEEFKAKGNSDATTTNAKEKSEPKKSAPKPSPAQFVKSAKDVAEEKEAKAVADKPKAATPVATPKPAAKPAPIIPPAPSAKPAPKPPVVPVSNGSVGQAPKLPPVKPAPAAPTQASSPAQPSQPKPMPAQPSQPKTAPKATPTESAAPANDGEIKVLHCKPPIVVRDFATSMDIKPFKLISELMEMGIFASMNQVIDEDIAQKVAEKHGFLLEIHHRGETQEKTEAKAKAKEKVKADEAKFLEPRPPVICVLGHVDHGKTTLLDTIRKANVVSGEAGGITQHIGAYQVNRDGQFITVIDTPGHAAFSKMRQRGADITDIAILVVAADDGFMPQTLEALKFAQNSNVPVVVAINKMDAPGANVERVKQQMQQHNIAPEEWGGTTQCTPVSAVKATNIDELLSLVLLEAEMLELKANPKCPAEGVVVESQMEVGRGATASIIVQKGTLKTGDAIVSGGQWCKVRAMMDHKGNKLKSAGPSTPVRLLGWSGTPESGGTFQVVKNEKEARKLAEAVQHETKLQVAADASGPVDLDNLFSAIASTKKKTFKVFVKGDVHGTVEAICACLNDIESEKIDLEVINSDVGLISKNDIITANAANAAIVGFNTKLDTGVLGVAKNHNVSIIQHNIIYELIDQVKEAMTDTLEPELRENKLGAAEIRQVFTVSKAAVAGSMVTEGRILRSAFARVFRKGTTEPLYQGKISMLKRFKDDATEVKAGYECGIQLDKFNGIKEGDIIECFEINKIKPSL